MHGPGALVHMLLAPVHRFGGGQVGSVVHAPAPPHAVSQAHELWQSIPPTQESWPEQSISHAPAPQAIGPWHADGPVHVTRQLAADVQSTPPAHAESPSQWISQSQPAGQLAFAQSPVPGHWMTHVAPAHEVHAAGHPAASIALCDASIALCDALSGRPLSTVDVTWVTHQPSWHVRPPVQSAGPAQRNSPERVSKPQPAAKATNNATTSADARRTRRLETSLEHLKTNLQR